MIMVAPGDWERCRSFGPLGSQAYSYGGPPVLVEELPDLVVFLPALVESNFWPG